VPTFLGYSLRHKREKVNIYFISDPFTNDIFYVGKTELTLNQRLNGHISTARKLPGKRLSKRIIEIIQKGKRPVIEILEVVDYEDWQESEIFWIKKFEEIGHPLLNIHRGGRGW